MSTLYPISRFLDTVGDGTGIMNAIGNYSATPTKFKYVSSSGHGAKIATIALHISANTNFALSSYGNIAGGLTKGITIQTGINGVEHEMLSSPLKNIDDLFHLSPALSHVSFAGGGDSICIPITAAQFGFIWNLNSGDYIQFTLNDNFSGLASHHFIVYGYTN